MFNKQYLLSICFLPLGLFGQLTNLAVQKNDIQIDSLEKLKSILIANNDVIKLVLLQQLIQSTGVPKNQNPEKITVHSAMQLSYNEKHEQANWVMHVIPPDILRGNFGRSNDFREDIQVETGTSVDSDYFIRTLNPDSITYTYDGFGYDRGHLAPSADFKWNGNALSESYLYSNMSPQVADFNRLKWAELEDWLRSYVDKYKVNLVVITAPVLNESLSKIERGTNRVSIPKLFVKAALDLTNQRAIGFVMPNEKIKPPVEAFAVTIDSLESLIGYDLFSGLEGAIENSVESQFDISYWLPNKEANDVLAIDKLSLPKNVDNTYTADTHVNDGKIHTVCGTAVSTKKSNKGNVFINLDKRFPNQIFSVSIFEKSVKNFSYEPEIYLINKKVCFTGKLTEYNGIPSMVIENEKQVRLLEDLR